ncbi:hypothetical protein LWM68_08225 [Niabella sp. W65]|nr:hypothetical protein [Niabella sp. W65]MCH7362751.1 hypothetical protein [Niabella sp. W65]ULT38706.1 hypothetical protein KRR40_26900 [Niabella sp. I65]
MKTIIQRLGLVLLIVLPGPLYAQGLADEIAGLQGILEQLYDEMITLAGDIIPIGRSWPGLEQCFILATGYGAILPGQKPLTFIHCSGPLL